MNNIMFWVIMGLSTGAIFVLVDTACYFKASNEARLTVPNLLPGGGIVAWWRTRRTNAGTN